MHPKIHPQQWLIAKTCDEVARKLEWPDFDSFGLLATGPSPLWYLFSGDDKRSLIVVSWHLFGGGVLVRGEDSRDPLVRRLDRLIPFLTLRAQDLQRWQESGSSS